MRFAWAIACRYVEVNDGLATIVGAGANLFQFPESELPGDLVTHVATQIAGNDDEMDGEHHLRGHVLAPNMEPVGNALDVPDLVLHAGDLKPPGWEATVVVPIIMQFPVEEPGTYTIELSIDDRTTTVPILVIGE